MPTSVLWRQKPDQLFLIVAHLVGLAERCPVTVM
jgi:hypothetical protein